MDLIHNGQPFTQQYDHSLNDRALIVTSGNRQVYTTNKHDSIKSDNRRYSKRYHDGNREIALAITTQYGGIHFPAPKSILGSNDRGIALRQTLAHRRLWQRLNAPRPYMNHPAYIRYTNRTRRDTSKSGDVIWNDASEQAFQNALACIPPMGKKKRSQNGKPHGRNELIAEWILYETGVDVRKRKQVSSHLQVLDNYLKEVPEWQAVRRERDSDKKKNNDSASDYFFNSIEEVVREVKKMKSDPFYRLQYTQDQQLLDLNDPNSQRLRLRQIDFGMWVSLPNSMDHPSHRYTALHNNLPQHVPVPLDDIMNWETSFPDLESIVQTMSSPNEFDIILLDVTLRLMKHFPMPTSKLGISLGLDFAASDTSTQIYENFNSWISTTHIYHSGKTIRSTEPKQCPISESRMVKPPFESKWWACEFTRLTDERQRAEDTGDRDAVYHVDESNADYLRNLSMMQQIYAVQDQADSKSAVWQGGDMKQKRIAILLWRFSAAPLDENGMTTWQRIAPSVDTSNIDCVEPINIQMESPSTMLHNPIDELHQTMYCVPDGYRYPMVYVDHTYSPNPDEELCHDGFVLGAQQDVFDRVNDSLHHVAGHADSTSRSFNTVHDLGNVNLSQHLIDYGHMPQEMSVRTDVLNNYFHQVDQIHHHEDQTLMMQQKLVRHSSLPESCHETDHDQDLQHDHHQPLQNFDVSTHKVLQEQLGTFMEESKFDLDSAVSNHVTQGESSNHVGNSELDEEGLKQALMAASTMDHVEGQQDSTYLTSEQTTGYPGISQSCTIAPIAVRPPLRQNHSFAGILPSQSHSMLDIQQHQISGLLARLEHGHELAAEGAEHEYSSVGAESTNNDFGHGLVRAHSQPDFSCKKFEDRESMRDECADGGYVMVDIHGVQETGV